MSYMGYTESDQIAVVLVDSERVQIDMGVPQAGLTQYEVASETVTPAETLALEQSDKFCWWHDKEHAF